jgi:hypothetical protein
MGMRFQALDVQVVASGADGPTLVGEPVPADPTQPLIALPVPISTDDGAAWTAPPVYPAPLLCCSTYNIVQLLTGRPQAAAVAPDGTVVTYLLINGGGGAGGILALAPGAARWRYVAAPPTESFAAFHFEAAGHITAIWGATTSGLQYRSVERGVAGSTSLTSTGTPSSSIPRARRHLDHVGRRVVDAGGSSCMCVSSADANLGRGTVCAQEGLVHRHTLAGNGG